MGQEDGEKAAAAADLQPATPKSDSLLVRVPGESTNRSAGKAGCEDANTLARRSDAAQAVAQRYFLF